jgi:hypothetical protein
MYASKRHTNWSPSLQTGFGGVGKDYLHPAVLQLGLRYAEGSIVGGTNRTLALMATLKTVIDQLIEDGSDVQLRTLLKQIVDKNVQVSEATCLQLSFAVMFFSVFGHVPSAGAWYGQCHQRVQERNRALPQNHP